ncbi:hypothetical protein H310_13251 [Aphanomyces invadans]|uniref:Uncharacterized protein n=1 Tax=Aphanomyces invadans TaxID=157072 RepID=A0A024TFI6_9STRA|nr:hypothetical protein H310_13251 [Aphanomyces invadans]ETV92351.1 hypothetical protein H310_13251 [Aphanomyces invadans]|eukprot:XP_008878902.1 hypothetical protein H310_13251 [Aphanomyces invadans]
MAVGWVLRQLGPRFRSNNAGDGPEKTRDRKFWFPRFKSTLLGSYRSKATYVLCECALPVALSSSPQSPSQLSTSPPQHAPTSTTSPSTSHRSKTTNGNHCACGRDEWHMAKKVEEKEYAMRLEVSKQYGGMRYDDAVAQHNADVEQYIAHMIPHLPCKFFTCGCFLCDADTSRRVAQRRPPTSPNKFANFNGASFIPDVNSIKTEYNEPQGEDDDDMAPLPLHMDQRVAHWKDPALVHDYLGCFLDADAVMAEFSEPQTSHYTLQGRNDGSTAMDQVQTCISTSPTLKVEPPQYYSDYYYT